MIKELLAFIFLGLFIGNADAGLLGKSSTKYPGQCGASNGMTLSSIPTTGLCNAGVPSSVAGTGPWSWTCAGRKGGANASCSASLTVASGGVELPGPSADLFANPPYQCLVNYYVATTGSNATGNGSSGNPWATITYANSRLPTGGAAAGYCVNVLPGTYITNGVTLSNGGNAATPTGYVVYRCTVMDACLMQGTTAQNWIIGFHNPNGVNVGAPPVAGGSNYIMLDGFTVYQSSFTDSGYTGCIDSSAIVGTNIHHLWLLNNITYGCGGACINVSVTEWVWAIHNIAHDCSKQNPFQTSGINFVVMHAVDGYTPTAMDNLYSPYKILILWNLAYNNTLRAMGSGAYPAVDGNGIILDTFNNSFGVAYPNQTLVAFNISYQNGGGGVHVFISDHATIINNTTYDNYNYDKSTNGGVAAGTPGNFDNGSNNTTEINNIGYAPVNYQVGPSDTGSHNCGVTPGGSGSTIVTWTTNIAAAADGAVSYCKYDGSWNCTGNKCLNADPGFMNAAAGNFALAPGSPAIGYGTPQTFAWDAQATAQSVDAGACYHTLAQCP